MYKLQKHFLCSTFKAKTFRVFYINTYSVIIIYMNMTLCYLYLYIILSGILINVFYRLFLCGWISLLSLKNLSNFCQMVVTMTIIFNKCILVCQVNAVTHFKFTINLPSGFCGICFTGEETKFKEVKWLALANTVIFFHAYFCILILSIDRIN